jgi:site-specific DNA-methyltransferase (adenine-specific)
MDRFLNQIIEGDCLEVMKDIPDKSVDMILCDLPYGTTACKWDTVIPFEPLWEQYKRLIKSNGAIVLTASQPFTSALVMSNTKMFKYEWIWKKNRPTGMTHCANMPMKDYEDVLVFSKGSIGHRHLIKNRMNYFPQGVKECNKINSHTSWGMEGTQERKSQAKTYLVTKENYPRMVLEFKKDDAIRLHPTQKPVALFEYLIKTYTQPGEIVLDNCIGSGTTAIAAHNTGRFFIGIEKEPKYCEIARKRLEQAQMQQSLFA